MLINKMISIVQLFSSSMINSKVFGKRLPCSPVQLF